MNFTNSPYERMMKQVPRASRPETPKAPPGSPCHGCCYWRDVSCMGICYRELTRAERAAIRKLVVSLCANYDSGYGCLPLDCECYMLGKCWTDAYCKYFREAVLPNDPVLAASLSGCTVETRSCTLCGEVFPVHGKQVYCSTACAGKAQRRQQRDYMRKKRVSVEKCHLKTRVISGFPILETGRVM